MNNVIDDNIVLNRENHSYKLLSQPEIAFTSVTTFLDHFFEGFDAEKIAKKLVANYSKYADRTVESLMKEWDDAAKYGTIVHDEIEDWIKNGTEPKDIKSINGKRWLMNYKSKFDIDVLSEIIIYSTELQIAGTIDILAKDTKTDEYIIIDWKTSKKINKVSHNYKTGTHKVTKNILDCNFNHYSLQLSLYRYILEEYYNLRIRNQVIAHITDEGVETHIAPYFKREIIEMLKTSVN